MNTNERVRRCIDLLREAPSAGLKKSQLMRKCGVGSSASFYRLLGTVRRLVNVSCVNGCYRLDGDFEDNNLLWPGDAELVAMASLGRIAADISGGGLKEITEPFQRRLAAYVGGKIKGGRSISACVKVLSIHNRKIPDGVFATLLKAVCRKYTLRFMYTDAFGNSLPRTVSPQHLVRYKDNWYCDAWCHDRLELRIFSLDGLQEVKRAGKSFYAVPEELQRQMYATSFGIFSGAPSAMASIRFTGIAARYVQREQWHPLQKIAVENNEEVILTIPFHKSDELKRVICSWGSCAEVLSPLSLRQEVAREVRAAAEQYQAG